MLRFPPAATLVAALALAAPAAAPTPGDTLPTLMPGRRAYSFSVRDLKDGAQTTFGIWRVQAPDRSRGLLLDLAAMVAHVKDAAGSSTTLTQLAIGLGPRFRRYVATGGPVAPFLESGLDVGLGYSRNSFEGGSSQSWAPNVGARLAAGAEWFPLRRVSVGAETGLQGVVSYLHNSTSTPPSPVSSDVWSVGLTSFVSALTLQLYF